MLDDAHLARFSPLARRFPILFAEQLTHVQHREEFTNRFELVIPAADPEVGELRVWDDGDELTIGMGSYHHWHVPLYIFEDEPEDRRIDLAARAAVEETRDVMEGRTVLRITRSNGTVTGSMIYDPEQAQVPPVTADESEYIWTGRRRASH